MVDINSLNLLSCQVESLENKLLLNPDLLSQTNFDVNRVRICLPNGQIVPLLDNYKQELILFKNNMPRNDYNWLIVLNSVLVFINRSNQTLPLIIETNVSSFGELTPSTSSNNIKEVCIFILDTSGSMGGGRGFNANSMNVGKLGAAKKIIRDLVSQEHNTEYKVLPFSPSNLLSRNSRQLSMTSRWAESTVPEEMSNQPWHVTRPREEFIAYLDNLKASGGTPLYEKTSEGITKAIELAREFENMNIIYKVSVIILTDGMAGDGEPHITNVRNLIGTFMGVNSEGTPNFSSDIVYYYAEGEGGLSSGYTMGISPEKMISFHNNETGINEAGYNLSNRRFEDHQRMSNASSQNFRLLARR